MKNKAFSYKHIITYSILFIFFSYLYQTLLPFGDEPDFWIRARDYVKIFSAQPEWWVPFREFKPIKALNFLTSKLNHISDCHVGSSPLELFTHIDPNKCTQSDFQIILRVLINYLIILPLISFIFVCKLLKKKFADDFNNRVDVVLLTIIFPSYIYYQNLMSNEQLVYLLSITLFLSWKNRFITFILILLIISLDFGSALFPLCFYLFYHLVLICNKKEKKISNNIIFILTSFLLLSYILSYNLFGYILNLKILSIFPSLEKFILSIYSHHYYNGFIDKYPTFIRPLMAYFSFIFFTPGYLKSYLLIFLSIIFLLYFSFYYFDIYIFAACIFKL